MIAYYEYVYNAQMPIYEDIETTNYIVISKDNTEIELRWYTKKQISPGAAIVQNKYY